MLEVALIGSVLFALVLGLVTFAILDASDSAGTNAAREGARAAALNAFCADAYSVPAHSYDNTACPTAPSSAYSAILTAVTSKLGGLVVGTPVVQVSCLSGSATPLTAKFCDSSLVPDVDLVQVTVTWTREATNPVTGTATHTDSARMTVQGSGKGASSSSSACLANATVNPSTVALAAGTPPTSLSAPVTVTVYTNGDCAQPLYLGFSTGPGGPISDGSSTNLSEQMSPMPNGTDFTYQIPTSTWEWDAGTYLFTVTDGNSNRITFVAQPQLTVTGTTCQFISAQLSPSSAIIVGGSSSGILTQQVTVTLTTSSGCQTVSTQFTPSGSTALSVTMPAPAPNLAGQLVYTLRLDPLLQWSIGLKAFSFTDVTDGSVPLRNETAVNLNVTTLCAFQSVSVNPDPVGHNNGSGSLKSDVTITATPSVGADCSGLTLTFSPASGTTTQTMVLQGSGVYQYTINKNVYSWTTFTYTITFGSTNNPAFSTNPPTTLTVN